MDVGQKNRIKMITDWRNEHPASVKGYCKRLYEKRREEGLCVRCGRQDESTKIGAVRCRVCAAAESRRRRGEGSEK